jgi:hypothetical protein
VYGGEYGELCALITVVVKAWLAVGLRPHFVFDGEDVLDLRRVTWTKNVAIGQVPSLL